MKIFWRIKSHESQFVSSYRSIILAFIEIWSGISRIITLGFYYSNFEMEVLSKWTIKDMKEKIKKRGEK